MSALAPAEVEVVALAPAEVEVVAEAVAAWVPVLTVSESAQALR